MPATPANVAIEAEAKAKRAEDSAAKAETTAAKKRADAAANADKETAEAEAELAAAATARAVKARAKATTARQNAETKKKAAQDAGDLANSTSKRKFKTVRYYLGTPRSTPTLTPEQLGYALLHAGDCFFNVFACNMVMRI